MREEKEDIQTRKKKEKKKKRTAVVTELSILQCLAEFLNSEFGVENALLWKNEDLYLYENNINRLPIEKPELFAITSATSESNENEFIVSCEASKSSV